MRDMQEYEIIEAKRNVDLVLIKTPNGIRWRSKKDFTPEELRDHWKERRQETRDGQA